MFDFLKRKKTETIDKTDDKTDAEIVSSAAPSEHKEEAPTSFFTRLKQGLAKTRANFTSGIANLFLGKKELNADLLNEIEMLLLTADVGVETTDQLIKTLTQKLARKELSDAAAA